MRRRVSDEARRLRRISRQWVTLWKREKRTNEERKTVGEQLMRVMKRMGLVHVPVGRSKVQLLISRSKQVAKKDLEGFWTPKEVEAFWRTLEDHISEYLTLVPPAGLDPVFRPRRHARRERVRAVRAVKVR